MSPPPVLILGARSDIGMAVAHSFAACGHPLQLAARHVESLGPDKADIELRHGVPVALFEFDALATQTHEAFVANLPDLPQIAICAVGLMSHRGDGEDRPSDLVLVMRSNYEGPASILEVLAGQFERRGSGTLVGISSVAGERGRATNYVYGSAKAGFTAFLSGLRNRLAGLGVHVVTVLPGFVATRMTEDMSLPAWLTAQPGEVAEAIVRAVARRRDVIYVRPIWRAIMLVIRSLPEALFKRLRV